eukprot:9819380-Karenia_brevis.AAC.1
MSLNILLSAMGFLKSNDLIGSHKLISNVEFTLSAAGLLVKQSPGVPCEEAQSLQAKDREGIAKETAIGHRLPAI